MSTDRRPCEGALFHSPIPAERDAHHVRPTYLCALLGVPKEMRTVLLCSGCHDLAHHTLRHLINNGSWGGHRLPAQLHAIVDDAWVWWQATVAAKP
jgi:hypothetical protein